MFEVNIRYIGGLLAAYYLTGEEVCVSSSVYHTVTKAELKGFLHQLFFEHRMISP